MEDEFWKELVESLVAAKRSLSNAWTILDGADGAADGSDHAFLAATSAIDAVFAIESAHEWNQDVAVPVEIQKFWDDHGQLPGFAAGT